MAANVIIEEWNGTGGSETRTDKTSGSIRFKNADNATVDLSNPLVVPGSGQEYSYEKWVRLAIEGGAFTQVDNLQVYTVVRVANRSRQQQHRPRVNTCAFKQTVNRQIGDTFDVRLLS